MSFELAFYGFGSIVDVDDNQEFHEASAMLREKFTYTIVSGLFLMMCSQTAFSDPIYTVTILGQVGGEGESGAAKINSSGQVAFTGFVGGTGNAMLYTPGSGVLDLGTIGGGNSIVNGLNDQGQVVGYSVTSTNVQTGFLYSGGQMQNLGAGGIISADGINNSGEVVGESTGNTNFHVITYANGVYTDLTNTVGGPPSGSSSDLINSAGMITGSTYNGSITGWLYNPGNAVTPPFTSFEGLSVPGGINSSGFIAGTVRTNGYYAAEYNPTTGITSSLGLPSGPYGSTGYGINDNGDIVGSGSYPGALDTFAFLYTNSSGWVDLNTLIPSDPNFQLKEATGINDNGQIVGYGFDSTTGINEVFLLTPAVVPEPPSIVISTIGLMILSIGFGRLGVLNGTFRSTWRFTMFE